MTSGRLTFCFDCDITKGMGNAASKILETGNIYFFYRPKIGKEPPGSLAEIQRFYLVLKPKEKNEYRLIIIGKKRMPELEKGRETFWGFVKRASANPEDVENELDPEKYGTKTRGEREIPAARPAGEGIYAVALHNNDHTHLAYVLEFPQKTDEVQEELNIEKQASYVINIKNPDKPAPLGIGLGPEKNAEFPEDLQKKFEGRRFYAVNPPDFLNYENAEIIFVGAKEDVGKELGIEHRLEEETNYEADVFRDLKLEQEMHPAEPLFKGEWA